MSGIDFKQLVESSSELICFHSPDGIYLYVSPIASKLLGYTSEELIGKSPYNFFHPEDKDRIRKGPHQQALNRQHTRDFKYRFLKKNGDYIWLETSTDVVLDERGEVSRLITKSREVTEVELLKDSIRELSEELEEQRHFYMSLLRSLEQSALVSRTDHEGVILEANDEFCQISGYLKEELIGKNHRILNSGLHSKSFWEGMWLTVKSGKRWRAEVCNKAKDGSLYWVDTVITPVFDRQGNIIQYLSIRYLISDKVRLRDEMNRAKELLIETNDAAKVGGWEVNLESKAVYWSDYTKLLHGVPSDYVPSLSTAIQFFKPGYSRETITRLVEDAILTGTPYEAELILIGAGGREIWVRTFGKPEIRDGKVVRLFGAIQNIEKQKRIEATLLVSEERLSMAARSGMIGWWEYDAESGEMTFSDIAASIHGILPGSYTVEDVMRKLLFPEDVPKISEAIAIALKESKPYDMIHRIRKGGNDEIVWVKANGQLFFNEFTGVSRIIGITQDITYQKQSTDELKLKTELLEAKNHELEKTNHELDSFVYKVSHDLRAPLTSALGLAELTALSGDIEEMRGYAKLQQRTLEKLDNYIIDILNFSRNSRLEVKSELIDLERLVNEVLEENEFQIKQAGIKIELDIVSERPIYSDDFRLSIILKNLLSNSVKFFDSKKEERFIQIKSESSSDHFKISINDNGIGIAEKHKDKVFNMFYRGTDTNYGSGLGLYIVADCLHRLGGTITMNSDYGHGTSFLITIPNQEKN